MRVLIGLVLLFITATLAIKFPVRPLPPIWLNRDDAESDFIFPRIPKIWADDSESDIAWAPVAAWAGRAALGAAGSWAYNKVFRRDNTETDIQICVDTKFGKFCYNKDQVESDFLPLAPIAAFAGRAALGAAGAYAYNKVFRRDNTESDIQICVDTKFGKFCYNKDQVESDFLPLAPIAAFAGRAALGAAGAYAYNKVFRRDNTESDLQICVDTKFGKFCYNKDQVEGDSEFLGKLISKVKNVAGKVKGVVEKGKAAYANGKNIFDSAKNIIGMFKKPKQQAQSDFLGALKLGMTAFKAIKGLKKNKKPKAQPESELLKDMIGKLKEKLKAKIAKLQEKKASKKAAQKPVEESDLLFKDLVAKIKAKIADLKNKLKPQEQPQQTESDAEFIDKLKNWWNNKGKDLFAKGKKIYDAYKQIKAQQ